MTKQKKHASPSDTRVATLSDYWSIILRSISFRGVKSHLWRWSVISLSGHLDIKPASGLGGNGHEGGADNLLATKKKHMTEQVTAFCCFVLKIKKKKNKTGVIFCSRSA